MYPENINGEEPGALPAIPRSNRAYAVRQGVLSPPIETLNSGSACLGEDPARRQIAGICYI